MFDPKVLTDIAQKLNQALPPAFKNGSQEFEKTAKTILQAGLAKLNLVTREEFDQQVRLLERCQQEIAALEERVKRLDQ